jgi:hypothetical protein
MGELRRKEEETAMDDRTKGKRRKNVRRGKRGYLSSRVSLSVFCFGVNHLSLLM